MRHGLAAVVLVGPVVLGPPASKAPLLARAYLNDDDAGEQFSDGSVDAKWTDAPAMVDGDLNDAAILDAPIVLDAGVVEAGPDGGLDDAEPLLPQGSGGDGAGPVKERDVAHARIASTWAHAAQ